MSSTGNIRATDLGSESYLWTSPNNSSHHLLGPNQEDGKHQPGPKQKLTSSYIYPKVMAWPHTASSSLSRYMEEKCGKVDDGRAYAIGVQTTEGDAERSSQPEDDFLDPTHDDAPDVFRIPKHFKPLTTSNRSS